MIPNHLQFKTGRSKFYSLQTKFGGKVMFFRLSVCSQGGRESAPPELQKRMVHMLKECFLVFKMILVHMLKEWFLVFKMILVFLLEKTIFKHFIYARATTLPTALYFLCFWCCFWLDGCHCDCFHCETAIAIGTSLTQYKIVTVVAKQKEYDLAVLFLTSLRLIIGKWFYVSCYNDLK